MEYLMPGNDKSIIVNTYDFNTSIQIQTGIFGAHPGLIKCTKLQFDKAFNLALACIKNKALNTTQL